MEGSIVIRPHKIRDGRYASHNVMNGYKAWTEQGQAIWATDDHNKTLGERPEVEYDCNNVVMDNPLKTTRNYKML